MYFKAASCLALGCAMLISPSQAQRPDVATNRAESDTGALRADPVTTTIAVGVVTGLATDMIKSIADTIQGDVRAQVQVHAKTDGPDAVGDHAENADSDFSDWWFEYHLTANTGLVIATHGHMAWMELNYHYDLGAWRPDPNGGYSNTHLNRYASARSYSSPWLSRSSKTQAAAIGAFSINGNKPKIFVAEDGPVTQIPGGGRSGHERGFEENWYVEGESLATLGFSAERFQFISNGADTVLARPIGFIDADGNYQGTTVQLFHSVSMIGEPAPIIPSFQGLNDSIDAEMDWMAQQLLADSGGNAVYEPDASEPVDLTITGAAIELHEVVLSSVDAAGQPLDAYDLLVAYFEHADAWTIVAPRRAQVGYEPDVIFAGPVNTGRRLDTLPPNLAELIPGSVVGGTLASGVKTPETELVMLAVAVQGTLEDAVTLGSNTPGHKVEQLTSTLSPGDTFELDTWFNASSMSVAEDVGLATPICPTDTDMNGQTDVSDLLNTLSDWGSSCEAECTGDTNDDGTVDIQDLLGIIGSWGNCPVPTGACCSGSDCFDNATEEFCNATGGEFKGSDTVCEYECFITGGCCLSNTCLNEWTEEACLDSAGTWLGQDVPCTDGSCPAPLGMCCQGGSCWQETEQECIALSGNWYGSEADCSMMVCDARSCCLDETSCVMVDETTCAYLGGTSGYEGESCDDAICLDSQLGACCTEWGGCFEGIGPEDCKYMGGWFLGGGSTCISCQ